MNQHKPKVALVTGGASGLGAVIAQRLKRDGAIVVISDVQVETGQKTATEEGFTFFQQDVCDEAQWIELLGQIEGRFGRLDVLVNNAGILGPRDAISPEHARLEDWKKIFAVNVEGVFLGCKSSIPVMRRAGGGSIINISSVAGLLATPYATAYGASKGAVRHITKSVAQYCAEQRLNIRCNSVHPGDVMTGMFLKLADEAARMRGVTVECILEEGRELSPMRNFTPAEEITAGVAYLASDDARHVTGTKLIIDGGIVNCDTYHMMSRSKTS